MAEGWQGWSPQAVGLATYSDRGAAGTALAEGEAMTDQVPVEVPIPTAPVVVANDGAPTLAQPAKAPARTGPKWEMEVRDRVKASIKKFSKPLSDLVARDANEGDTRLLITDFLCEGRNSQ